MNVPVQQGLLPIEYLLAAPLEALVRAQAMAARTTAEFVGEVGFETDKEGVSRARMVDFEYIHPMADPNQPGHTVDTPVRVRVPVLSLMSVPNVAVEEATVELNLRVVGQQSNETEKPAAALVRTTATAGTLRPNSMLLPANRLRMVGAITAPKLAEQSASVRVTIKLRQAPAPEGLNQILSLLGEGISARPTKQP